MLGRLLYRKTNIKYGIDYIDPWVRDISKDRSFKAIVSLAIAKFLEPIAVKNASLITGVALEYYKPVLDRNFIKKNICHATFPYGFDSNDHEIEIPDLRFPWYDRPNCKPIVYAGAFMPNSQIFLNKLFKAFAVIVSEKNISENTHLFFLGTGYYQHKSITSYANDHGISKYVTEIRDRIPYLHILNILSKADRLLIIGSTEKHYTASKTYQVILSKRPFMGMLHYESTAINVLTETNTDKFLVKYVPNEDDETFNTKTLLILRKFISDKSEWTPQLNNLNKYSALQSAKVLVGSMNSILNEK